MIITRIIGGLGNQMFQYAAGFRVAKNNQVELKIDTSAFATYPLHRLSIGKFAITAAVATQQEVRHVTAGSANPVLSVLRRVLRVPAPKNPNYIREPKFTFNPEVLDLTGSSLYLDGYWQSEKYFADVAEDLRKEFTVANAPDDANAAMLARIQSSESVCFHIRRGDYVKDQQANSVHGSLPLTYYTQALAHLSAKRDKLSLFFFSDDLDWVRQNFKTNFPMTFVDHNGPERDIEDVRLMAACKHHIIANSTFSWWGAWLGEHPGQVAIAPKQWFHTTDMDSTDLIPSRWLQL